MSADAMINKLDDATRKHLVRIGQYSRLLAQAIALPEERQELLLHAASLHDIGKVSIPERIVLKRGALTLEEWEIMKGHAQLGHEIMRDCTSPLLQLGAEIALTHHEKYDGSGYPQGLAGDAIPLSGRIVAITDVFDALLSRRPYKPAWPLEDALEYLLEERRRHFDPVLVDAFLENISEVQEIRRYFADEDAA
jgi:two-component system, response regulator RpfG